MAMIMRWLWTFMNKFQDALTHLVYLWTRCFDTFSVWERERESCFPSGRLRHWWHRHWLDGSSIWCRQARIWFAGELGKKVPAESWCVLPERDGFSVETCCELCLLLYTSFTFFQQWGAWKGQFCTSTATKAQVQLISLGSYCGPKLSFQKMGRGAATLPFEARQVRGGIWGSLRRDLWQIQVSQCCKTMMFV